MILTLTMNPALDITTSIGRVVPTHKMRCGAPRYDPGGGGINVAKVARCLGSQVSAIFPAGGATGESLCRRLADAGVPVDRVPVGEPTRESFTINEIDSRQQYRFVLPGPTLSRAEWSECLGRLEHLAPAARFVVVSGSLPPGVPDDFYQRTADICRAFDVPLILDISGAGLRELRGTVFLLKPSLRELCEFTDSELTDEADQAAAARELIASGRVRNVVLSLGADGALLVTSAGAHRFAPLTVPSGSGVGAGDAMVAGIVVGLVRGWPLTEAVQLGTAAGAAMLLTPGTAGCRREDVDRLLGQCVEPVTVG
jgi:6-phosphofructokinase 2